MKSICIPKNVQLNKQLYKGTYNLSTPIAPLSAITHLFVYRQREREAMKDERTHRPCMAQWILNRNNRFVLASASIFCIEKINWPYFPTASRSYGREGGRQAGRQTKCGWVLKFLKFSIAIRLNCSGFYFVCYHSNAITQLYSIRIAFQSAFVK